MKNFAFHLYSNDFNPTYFSGTMNYPIDIYILCKYSFNKSYQNIDVGKLVNNDLPENDILNLFSLGIKTDFTFSQIMSLKKIKLIFIL